MRFGAGSIAGLCNGSTPDSDSVCEGSNPSPAAKIKSWNLRILALFLCFSVLFRPFYLIFVSAIRILTLF